MHTLTIKALSHNYSVEIEQTLFDNMDFTPFSAIIIDQYLTKARQKIAEKAPTLPIFTYEATESNKSLAMVERILLFLNNHHITKSAHILIVGGGILHDTGGLVASLYMRGIKWSFVPTTLLSMVDACIGGKCAVNIEKRTQSSVTIKNLIGAIYPPYHVFIDPNFTTTLSSAQIYSGLAEVAKSAFLMHRYDGMILNNYVHLYNRMTSNPSQQNECLADLIALSLEVKKFIIERDEFDTNERRYLNFGHTFGHAIESATHYRIEHGLAIAIGMVCAIDFAATHMGIQNNTITTFKQHIKNDILAPFPKLSNYLKAITWETFWNAFNDDKKHDTQFELILPAETGGVDRIHFTKSNEIENNIKDILNDILNSLGSH